MPSKKLILFLVTLLLVGVVLFEIYYVKAASISKTTYTSPVPTLTPTPTPAKDIQVNSANGKMRIVMKRATAQDGRISYSFFTSDTLGGSESLIFTKTFASDSAMSVPSNAWSPDNKYVFLQENDNPSTFFVFKATGEAFSNGQQYRDILPLFNQRETKYKLSNVTGWDDPSLLHVLTTSADGKSGPSFWFDVPSSSFIQLAR